jgi:hypothetical protein
MNKPSETVNELTPVEHAAEMADYLLAGHKRANDLSNRGPFRTDEEGSLHPDILAAYWEHGFYVFEGVVEQDEVDDLRIGVQEMIDRAPSKSGAKVDALGRPALGIDYALKPYLFIKPLSDPWGGTDALAGRHPMQMTQPTPDAEAPDDVVYLIFGMCQSAPAALRLYGHPQLLTIADGINGSDFVPYNDAVFVKQPGLGGSVAWHQDGATHWDSPDWDEGIHGFNFQVQLYDTTPANALWVVPGTHKHGRVDIVQMVTDAGSDCLPDAVPLICEAGDVTIVNRQTLHGSFANTSPDPRISVTFGFHRRSSVTGVEGKLKLKSSDTNWGGGPAYDEQQIFDRSAVIAVAIDARHQVFVDETPYRYEPFAGLEDDFRYCDETVERVIRDYNVKDLAI